MTPLFAGRSSARFVDPARQVYRPIASRLLLGVLVAIGAWGLVDLAGHGRGGAAVLAAVWLVAAVSAMACLFWRPAVVVDAAGVELRNVVRDVRVPWPALDAVTTRYTLTLHAGGRRHQSWVGAAPGRQGLAHRLPDERWNPSGVAAGTASRALGADSGATAFMVEQGWRSWRERQGSRAPDRAGGAGGAGDVGAVPDVEIRWAPVLPAVALGAAALAVALTPLLG